MKNLLLFMVLMVIGRFPNGTLMVASNGFIYGTAVQGGQGPGTLFRLNPNNNSVSPAVFFNGSNGSNTYSNLVEINGSLFGITLSGGASNSGVIFEYDITAPNGNPFAVRRNLQDIGAQRPYGGLVLRPKDNPNEPDRLFGLTFAEVLLGEVFFMSLIQLVLV